MPQMQKALRQDNMQVRRMVLRIGGRLMHYECFCKDWKVGRIRAPCLYWYARWAEYKRNLRLEYGNEGRLQQK